MSIALYRKYRPQSFSQITGQNHIKMTLQNEIGLDKIGHAYLFCGPRGTGKTTMARLLAKAANCLDIQKNGEPCNKCESCAEIMENRCLDVIEIDAASHTGVDNVRENIINNARFTPSKRKYKIFIIDEVHMLSISAFNALLKILEEPPAHVLFVLATTEVHKVPVTIISRCQRFDYKKININNLLERLKWIVIQEGVDIEEDVLKRIAKYSFGCVRDSESLLEKVLSLGEKKITLDLAELILPRSNFQSMFDLLKYIIEKNTKEAIELINQLMDEGIDINQFTNDFIEFLRKCLLYQVKKDVSELSQEVEEKSLDDLIKILKNISAGQLVKIIGIFMKSKEEFRQSYILQLPLELAIVELCEIARTDADVRGPTRTQTKKPAPNPIQSKEPSSNHNNQRNQDNQVNQGQDSDHINQVNQANQGPSVAQIKSQWPEIIKKIKKENYSLSMSLRVGQPINLIGNKILVAFPFSLQQQRVDNPLNRKIIEKVFNEIFEQKLILETKVDSSIKINDDVNDEKSTVTTTNVNDKDLSNAIDIFGGSVVE